MKLSDYEFFPGSIIDVADPKYQGRVKANSPTLFDTSMDKEGLPTACLAVENCLSPIAKVG